MGPIKALLWIALLLLTCNATFAQTWTEYRSAAGRYRVEMPGTPAVSSTPVKVGDGQAPLYQASVELGEVAFLVSYIDYPSSLFANMTLGQALVKARDGSAKGHTMLTDKEIMLGSNPAREYAIARTNGIVVLVRSVMSGTRLYQAIYAAPGKDYPQSPDARRFLDSLAITP